MCGIVGYVGSHSADELLLKGLRRLEYRGYDSVGIATGARRRSDRDARGCDVDRPRNLAKSVTVE